MVRRYLTTLAVEFDGNEAGLGNRRDRALGREIERTYSQSGYEFQKSAVGTRLGRFGCGGARIGSHGTCRRKSRGIGWWDLGQLGRLRVGDAEGGKGRQAR